MCFSSSRILIIITAPNRSLRRLCFHRCLSVHRGRDLCQGGFLSRGSLSGGLCPGDLCPQWDLYPVGYLSVGSLWVSLSDLSMSRGSLSREGVSVQGRGLCLGKGSLSGEGVSVWGGVSVQGSLSRVGLCPGGLCPVASLSRGSLSGRTPPVR